MSIGFAQTWGNLGCEKMSWDVLLLPQAMARIGQQFWDVDGFLEHIKSTKVKAWDVDEALGDAS